ncbi:hypothetical protein DRO19_02915 [Candidatus Bathyarchaeota archaeon]|nr:MAG: hypothetical protein DRO19_02915 [Candidatus Bathyarchaeota archaeon]
MRKIVRCLVCGRVAYTLYIRPTKTVPIQITEKDKPLLPLIKKLNPTLTRRVQYWKPIGYWCPFCGNVEIEEPPRYPGLKEKIEKFYGTQTSS